MGKRRIRNLQYLGFRDIAGFDTNPARLSEVEGKYGISTYDDFEIAISNFNPNIFIVCTPPDKHMDYAEIAYQLNKDCFIEASVSDKDRIRKLAKLVDDTKLIFAPSCTMLYSSGPTIIKELILSNTIGRVLFFNYHTGQYLPDWHPWENIMDYYVSNPETGAAREIVPFELTWLNNIFGKPKALFCVKTKLSEIEAEIDDIYSLNLLYPGRIMANINIEVLSRPRPTRELRIVGSEGEIHFSGESDCVKYIHHNMLEWKVLKLKTGTRELGYINPEEPYINELGDFIKAVVNRDSSLFPNTLLKDFEILEILQDLERIAVPINEF